MSIGARDVRGAILVAGIGNVMRGDDGFGVEVIRRLQTRGLRDDVIAIDFGVRGYDLAYALAGGARAAILVDSDTPEFQLSWWTIGVTALLSAALLILLIGYTWRALRRPVATGAEELEGAEARVLQWTNGEGYVHVHGERWHARGPAELAPQSKVRIEKLDGLTLVVH